MGYLFSRTEYAQPSKLHTRSVNHECNGIIVHDIAVDRVDNIVSSVGGLLYWSLHHMMLSSFPGTHEAF